MYTIADALTRELDEIDSAGLTKHERLIEGPQGAIVDVSGREVLNLCSNNYLGLANHPEVVAAAKTALDTWGFGMASVRFICGTQSQHVELEERLSAFVGQDETILYSSCYDANGGLFETLLGPDDAVISDALNHASIIDGIRLSKAARYRYANRDMTELEQRLVEASGARRTLIVTDGVFSMDGYYAPLTDICDLADRYGALVMVDDSHAVGFTGATGAGTPERAGVTDRVDIISGTLGKALGGSSGGFISARAEIVRLLRQRSRPYLFSNALAPAVVAASLKALDLAQDSGALRHQLQRNSRRFKDGMTAGGFQLLPGEHPISAVMFGDARTAARMADAMLDEGVYVTAFSFPVVPRGEARIRVQVSASHSEDDIDRAVRAFASARERVSAL